MWAESTLDAIALAIRAACCSGSRRRTAPRTPKVSKFSVVISLQQY
jgi:hypothetical protein